MKIHEQITPATWCQGTMFQTARGKKCRLFNAFACCAHGWLLRAYPYGYPRARNHFVEVNDLVSIHAWNDAPGRTFDEVKAAFRKADL